MTTNNFFVSTEGPEETCWFLRMMHAEGWGLNQGIGPLCSDVTTYYKNKPDRSCALLYSDINPGGHRVGSVRWVVHPGGTVYTAQDFLTNILHYNEH